MYENLLSETTGAIAVITINRETSLNALNKATLAEISAAVTSAIADTAVRGIIITGAGTKAFVAGADIREFSSFDPARAMELARTGQATVFDLIEHSSKPVLAAINGYALGGGLELAMACHVRIASSTARLGLPEVSLGLIPGYGGTQRLARLAGKGRAMELILTGEMIDAAGAERIGLVNRVSAPGSLIGDAFSFMNKMICKSPEALAAAIRAINASSQADGFGTEMKEFSGRFGTADFREGVAAFLEKRPPVFGR